MVVHKAYANEMNCATITCSQCGKVKVADVTPYVSHDGPVKVRCSCGYVFAFRIEKRKQYRKKVNLRGEYSRIEATKEKGTMIVEDLSRTGLQFRTSLKTDIQLNEIIKTRFVLDNSQKSVVIKNVVVRRVEDCCIGAEFCDNRTDKDLAFYLMP